MGVKRNIKVPFVSFEKTNATIKQEISSYFDTFFSSKNYILGPSTVKFEEQYATYSNTKNCIGVGNGLDALQIALKALGIGENDEVIVPSNTYIASVLSISLVGAKPVFVEPRIDTYNIDVDKIEEKISSKTKAILPVHLYGQPAEMGKIMDLASNYNLFVIEDNAQAQGAYFDGKLTGSFGTVNATSFYPSKNLGALGDGGAITTDDDNIAEISREIRNYGSKERYYNNRIGVNSRLDEFQAGVLSIKLHYLDLWNEERRKIATWYTENLVGLSKVILPYIDERAISVFHLFVIRIEERDLLKSFLEDNGVITAIHYPIPPHMQKAYKKMSFSKGDFPIAEKIANTCLSLPMYIGISKQEVDYVCECIFRFYKLSRK